MTSIGEYADTLRALGRFLDQVSASEIVVVEHGDELEVAWCGCGPNREMRRFAAADLAGLQITARLYRGLEGRAPRFTLVTLLRTLGALVDERGAGTIVIGETADGFRLTAQTDAGELHMELTTSEVVELARTAHRQRLAAPLDP